MTGDDPDVRRLAELDAGLLDQAEAATARRAAARDLRAARVLDALAATRTELRALPAPTLPPEVAARWSAALAREHDHRPASPALGSTPRTVRSGESISRTDRSCNRPERRRRGPGRAGLFAGVAAMALAAVLGVAVLGRPVAPEPAPGLALARIELAAAGTAAIGRTDLGPLSDPARRVACLAAVGAAGEVLGGREVVLEGTPGVLLVLGTGTLGRFRLLVVDPACGHGGTVLAETIVGR